MRNHFSSSKNLNRNWENKEKRKFNKESIVKEKYIESSSWWRVEKKGFRFVEGFLTASNFHTPTIKCPDKGNKFLLTLFLGFFFRLQKRFIKAKGITGVLAFRSSKRCWHSVSSCNFSQKLKSKENGHKFLS